MKNFNFVNIWNIWLRKYAILFNFVRNIIVMKMKKLRKYAILFDFFISFADYCQPNGFFCDISVESDIVVHLPRKKKLKSLKIIFKQVRWNQRRKFHIANLDKPAEWFYTYFIFREFEFSGNRYFGTFSLVLVDLPKSISNPAQSTQNRKFHKA